MHTAVQLRVGPNWKSLANLRKEARFATKTLCNKSFGCSACQARHGQYTHPFRKFFLRKEGKVALRNRHFPRVVRAVSYSRCGRGGSSVRQLRAAALLAVPLEEVVRVRQAGRARGGEVLHLTVTPTCHSCSEHGSAPGARHVQALTCTTRLELPRQPSHSALRTAKRARSRAAGCRGCRARRRCTGTRPAGA